jgi:hypothetical protein
VISEIVTRRVKAVRIRARSRIDVTRESARAVTLGNLADTMPDIVASMISKVGILNTQSSNLYSTRGTAITGKGSKKERAWKALVT